MRSNRWRGGILALAAAVWAAGAVAQSRAGRVVLVTLDGARHQEVFGGMDLNILRSTVKGDVEAHPAYRRFWAPTPEERRARLMPFLWGTVMAHGSIAGNRRAGSVVLVRNRHRFSYPGYSEMLTGEAHDDVIKSNDGVQNPFESVLEFARRELRLPKTQVAVFSSWQTIGRIAERVPGSITTNTGVQRLGFTDPLVRQLDDLQSEIPSPWELIRPDAFTFRLGLAYMKVHKPRLFYLSFDETDDWAHDGKYDLVLDAYARTDRYLRELWSYVQSDPEYRGRTTLIVTTDHGRGETADDWRSHGQDVPGAEYIWLAIVSPDNPGRGEWRPATPLFQNQIAATMARGLGLDFTAAHPASGRAIEFVAAGAGRH